MRVVNLEIAKALRKLGHSIEYHYCHVKVNGEWSLLTLEDCERNSSDIEELYAAPRLDDTSYWLRDKYGIYINPISTIHNNYCYHINTPHGPYMNYDKDERFDSLEDALESAIALMLKEIKNVGDSRWHLCECEVPKQTETNYLCTDGQNIFIATWQDNIPRGFKGWGIIGGFYNEPIAWMELPGIPEFRY